MKKLISLVFCGIFLVSLSSCREDNEMNTDGDMENTNESEVIRLDEETEVEAEEVRDEAEEDY